MPGSSISIRIPKVRRTMSQTLDEIVIVFCFHLLLLRLTSFLRSFLLLLLLLCDAPFEFQLFCQSVSSCATCRVPPTINASPCTRLGSKGVRGIALLRSAPLPPAHNNSVCLSWVYDPVTLESPKFTWHFKGSTSLGIWQLLIIFLIIIIYSKYITIR